MNAPKTETRPWAIADGQQTRVGLESLGPREQEILAAYPRLGRGKLIAYELGISEQTVKNHITNILRKLDCAAFGQAAVLFDRWQRKASWPAVERRRSGDRRKGERRIGIDRRGAGGAG